MTSQIQLDVYAAAHETAVLVNRSDLGVLKITGASRLDLIDRMSTQRVKNLQRGEGAATVLTTDIGRIIDRLILYPSSDSVYALTGEDNGANIGRYLMGYVFFNDDFHLQDISAETAVFAVYGPQAPQILGEVVGFPEVDMPLHHWREAEIATDDGTINAYLHRTDPINGYGYFVMSEAQHGDALWQRLRTAGLVVADEPAFDFLRIEAGLPRYGHELTQEYIPLEADLWSDVSFNKGCYVGQEIIARMESRGRIAKKLVQLRPDAPVAADSDIVADGKRVGTVTSVAEGPHGPLALGYVKTAALDEGASLKAEDTRLAPATATAEGVA